MSCGCAASLQSGPAWNGVTRDLHTQKEIKAAVSWQEHASVFWDSEGMIHDFLLHGGTMNAQYYSNLCCKDVHQVIWKKKPRKHIEGHPAA
jgi:hypothetical protein